MPDCRSIEELERRASELEGSAEAAVRTYDRGTWIRFALVFVPVPLVVVLLRLHLDAWGYYLAGALIIASAGVLFSLDGAARARRDRALRAAEEARRDREKAGRKRDAAGGSIASRPTLRRPGD